MSWCAFIDYKKADKALNETYQKLLAIHKYNKQFVGNVKNVQRAWIKFRDAEVKMKLTYVV